MKPETRRSGLLVRELPDEVVVYDLEQHRAHCLNRTAALVFKHADGTRTRADLARVLGPGGSDEVVKLALEELSAAGLMEPQPTEPVAASSEAMGRREVARRIGLAAAILLPAVATVVAPTPAEAAATCVTDCGGKLPGTLCSSFGANPCTETCSVGCGATCSTGACSDGGGA